jgi:serine/threonine-protein kinase
MSHKFVQQPSDSAARHASWAGLTPDLLEKARGRVKFLAWLMVGVMVFGAAADLTAITFLGSELKTEWIGFSVLGILASGGLLYMAHDRRFRHAAVLHATLAFEVGLCLFLAFFMSQIFYEELGHLPLVTWVEPVIILFPLIVPSPPGVTLLVALSAAVTRPVALLLLDLRGDVVVEGIYYYTSIMSPLFAVTVAYFGSKVVHGMTVDLAKAQRMGSYSLEALLGTGGMGEVWRARHQLLARPAAVKLVKPENLLGSSHDQRITLTRFEREAQVTAALRSAHTIQLYDFGITQTGTFFYVMELLNGLDLDELVTRFGPVSPARAVHFLRQICDSLGEAHEQNLIHRDIKPGNVYVCRYGRSVDFVKVLDFGLVKTDQGSGDSESMLTAQGSVRGTPAFIAPEQALGENIDARTDIYQIGCIAYWMLTGRLVFEGDTVIKTMIMHVQTPPERPSLRTEHPIPDELDHLVLRCLEKDPAKRPQTIDELSELLVQCGVRDPWTQERGQRWWQMHLPDRLSHKETALG